MELVISIICCFVNLRCGFVFRQLSLVVCAVDSSFSSVLRCFVLFDWFWFDFDAAFN